MSSCLVPYVGVWQHHLLWSQLWGSHISFQSLWLLEAPQLSNLHNLFSNCMQPLQHFQSSSTLYFSLLNTPAFLASSSIFHILCLTLPTLNSYFFIPSTFFPCTTNPVFFTSQAFRPTDSCRSAGGRMDAIATQLQHLGREITNSEMTYWRTRNYQATIRNYQATTAQWQWHMFTLLPHRKQEVVYLLVKCITFTVGWDCIPGQLPW